MTKTIENAKTRNGESAKGVNDALEADLAVDLFRVFTISRFRVLNR
jgi:hypothetical protein